MADVEEIKRRIDLAAFAEKRWGLRFEHAGRGQRRALCPLHQEKTASFVVFPDGGWYCYGGCNRGGDVIDLVMAKDRMDFRQALELVAREAGVELESFTPAQRASYQARRGELTARRAIERAKAAVRPGEEEYPGRAAQP